MSRLDENTLSIDAISAILGTNPDTKTLEGLKIGVLTDISKSLAIIADAVTEAGGKENGTQ